MANGSQTPPGMFEIPVVDADTGESFTVLSPSREPLSDADFDALLQAQAPKLAADIGSAAVEAAPGFIAREGPAAVLAAGAPLLAAGAPGLAGVGLRAGLAGVGALAGRTGSTLALEGRLPTKTEVALEVAGAVVPDVITGLAVDPSDTVRLINALQGTVGGKAAKTVTPEAFGLAFSKELPVLRERVFRETTQRFDRLRRIGDSLGVEAPISQDVSQAALEAFPLMFRESPGRVSGTIPVSQFDPTAGISRADAAALRGRLKRLADAAEKGESLPFSFLSETKRDLSRVMPQFMSAGAKTAEGQTLQTLDRALAAEMRRQAAGTRLAPELEATLDAFRRDLVPTRTTLDRLAKGNVAPEDVMNVLVKKPSRLRLVMNRLDEPLKEKMRAAYFNDVLQRSEDLAGVVDPASVAKTWRDLPPATRQLLAGGDAKSVDRIMRLLEAQGLSDAGRQRALQIVSSAGIGAGTGILVSRALADGNSQDLSPILLGVGAGAVGYATLAKILASPGARKFLQRGLAEPGPTGVRFTNQALARAGFEQIFGPPSVEAATPASPADASLL